MWSLGLGQGRGRTMIGSFVFSETPRANQVAVKIAYAANGRRLGQVWLSEERRSELEANPDYPRPSKMPFEAAFCYGLFLALKLNAPFVITGDPSAWDPRWGRLEAEAPAVSWLDNRFG